MLQTLQLQNGETDDHSLQQIGSIVLYEIFWTPWIWNHNLFDEQFVYKWVPNLFSPIYIYTILAEPRSVIRGKKNKCLKRRGAN